MAPITLTWTQFKAEVSSRKIGLQYVESSEYYYVFAFDGRLELDCILLKNQEAESEAAIEVAEFLADYAPSANKSPVQRKPFADPQGFYARFKGHQGVATKNATTNVDFCITETRWINGAQLILKNHQFDDTANFQVVDVDGLFTPPGTVLDEFVEDWAVISDTQNQGVHMLDYPARIQGGLYVRIVYKSTGTLDDVAVKLNFFLHERV